MTASASPKRRPKALPCNSAAPWAPWSRSGTRGPPFAIASPRAWASRTPWPGTSTATPGSISSAASGSSCSPRARSRATFPSPCSPRWARCARAPRARAWAPRAPCPTSAIPWRACMRSPRPRGSPAFSRRCMRPRSRRTSARWAAGKPSSPPFPTSPDASARRSISSTPSPPRSRSTARGWRPTSPPTAPVKPTTRRAWRRRSTSCSTACHPRDRDEPRRARTGHEDAAQGAGRRMGRSRRAHQDRVQRRVPGPHHPLRVGRHLEPARPGPPHAPHAGARDDGGAGPVGRIRASRARGARLRRPLAGRPEGSAPPGRDLLRHSRGQHRVQGSARGDRLAREEMTPLHHLVEGRGEPVVLVHAIGCDHRMWDSLASDLASSRYRVLRVDVRGHGESPVPDGEYSLEGLADDVLALLDSLEIEKAHWVGLSMGGMIGQAFALAHPGRLRRLVLANTTSGYGPDGPKMWEARMKAVRDGGMAAIAELVMQRYFSDAFRERHPEVVARMKERVLTTPAKGYISCCAAIRDLDS